MLYSIISNYLIKAEKQLSADRITFVSTKEINAYISYTAKKMNLSKGEVIRRIIEDDINCNLILGINSLPLQILLRISLLNHSQYV